MRRQTRKATLDSLVGDGIIERPSRSWLIEVLDPFHDTPIELNGMPDNMLAGSVIQCVKYTQQLKVPASLSGGNWDTNIVLWPQPRQDATGSVVLDIGPSGQSYAGSVFTNGSGMNNFPIGGVTAYSVVSGQQTYGDSDGATETFDLTLGLEQNFLDGNTRLIGMGMEICNTTAELYKQGSATVYRQPTPPPSAARSALFIKTSVLAREREVDKERKKCDSCEDPGLVSAQYLTAMGWVSTYYTAMPPSTLGQATKLTGTKTWDARDGAYCVATMNTIENPAIGRVNQASVYTNGEPNVLPATSMAVGFETVGTTDWLGPLKSGAAGNVQPIYGVPQMVAPFNISGCYLTGLSPQTTLQVSVVYYVERFPTPYDSNLVVLARPSAAFDPRALEIYGLAMNKLPVGVLQGENPLGEWFMNVLDKVAKVASPIARGLTMIPGIAAPAGIIGNVADTYMAARRPAKEKKKARKKAKKLPEPRGGPEMNRPKKILASPGRAN